MAYSVRNQPLPPRPGANFKTLWAGFRTNFFTVPVILQAYVVCGVLYTLTGFSTFLAPLFPSLPNTLAPYLGGFTIVYCNALIFAFLAISTPRRKQVYACVFMLGLLTLFGFGDMHMSVGLLNSQPARPNFGNPMLTFSPYRPLVTIVWPLGWLLFLLAPCIRQWAFAPERGAPDPKPAQFGTADLLHLVFTLAIVLALSIGLVGFAQRKLQMAGLGKSPLQIANFHDITSVRAAQA